MAQLSLDDNNEEDFHVTADVIRFKRKKQQATPFALVLRERMQARGWNAPDLAAYSGVSLSTVRGLLAGKKVPTMLTLDRLALVLGDEIDVFAADSRPDGERLDPFAARSVHGGGMLVSLHTKMSLEAMLELRTLLQRHGVELAHRYDRPTQLRLRLEAPR